MKRFLVVFLTTLLIDCNTPTKKEPTKTVVTEEKSKETVVEKKGKKVDNTLVTLQRKPCSGDCPVFDVVISKDSTLVYKGISYTNTIGNDTLKLSSVQYADLLSILENSDFSNLKTRYTKSGSKYFPQTIIKYQNKEVIVRLWKDAPEGLTDIYVFIEDILYDQKYLQ